MGIERDKIITETQIGGREMRKIILICTILMLCLTFSATVYATNVSWSSNDVSGTDPLGHPWKFLNFTSVSGTLGYWSIPGPGEGTVTFMDEFVKDFHITFDLGDFPGQEIIEGRTSFQETTNTPFVDWDPQLMDTDSDQRIDTVWFFAPPGEQLSSGDKFYILVEFALPWASIDSTFVTPHFDAQWTDTGSIPEPCSALLLSAGLAGVVLLRRRFKN
jgi:hypothetical protein